MPFRIKFILRHLFRFSHSKFFRTVLLYLMFVLRNLISTKYRNDFCFWILLVQTRFFLAIHNSIVFVNGSTTFLSPSIQSILFRQALWNCINQSIIVLFLWFAPTNNLDSIRFDATTFKLSTSAWELGLHLSAVSNNPLMAHDISPLTSIRNRCKQNIEKRKSNYSDLNGVSKKTREKKTKCTLNLNID